LSDVKLLSVREHLCLQSHPLFFYILLSSIFFDLVWFFPAQHFKRKINIVEKLKQESIVVL